MDQAFDIETMEYHKMVILYFRFDDEPNNEVEIELWDSHYSIAWDRNPLTLMHHDEADIGDRSVAVSYEALCLAGCVGIRYEVKDNPYAE